jgi:betaine/carnitine transporter, BCCT family
MPKDPGTSNDPHAIKGRHTQLPRLGLDFHNAIFPYALAAIVALSVYAMVAPKAAGAALNVAKNWTIANFDSFYMIAGNLFVVFCLVLVVTPLGKVRIGGASAKPEYGTLSYFSMLFAAGMGVGLLFWGVAEPVAYFTDWFKTPLNVAPRTPEARNAAMGATMFHWGLHPWAIYCTVALVVGYFSYNRGLPMSMRSGLQPLIGDAYRGWAGHVIDVFTLVLTAFGLSTSLGLGALQSTAGLHHVLGTPNSFAMQVAFILVVTGLAAYSVAAGMHAGVKLLSNINMVLALVLFVFVAIGAGFVAFLGGLGSTTANYAQYFLPLTNWIGRTDTEWFQGWTVFYWAWWASWAPFVGMFIARISRGRSIRQIVLMVMLAPTVVALLWMTAFGDSAIAQVIAGKGALAGGIKDVTLTLFQFLEQLPLVSVTSLLVVALLVIFMVTSVDSGCLVVDTIGAGGVENTPRPQRVMWVFITAIICLALFIVGGDDALKAVQAGAIALGLPFMLLMLVLMAGLAIALVGDQRRGATALRPV